VATPSDVMLGLRLTLDETISAAVESVPSDVENPMNFEV
jgi:hypothetical protein